MNIWINWFISLLYGNNKLIYSFSLNMVDDDDLDDDTWVSNKKKFWRKNNISPLKIKGGNISPKELSKILAETFISKKNLNLNNLDIPPDTILF